MQTIEQSGNDLNISLRPLTKVKKGMSYKIKKNHKIKVGINYLCEKEIMRNPKNEKYHS